MHGERCIWNDYGSTKGECSRIDYSISLETSYIIFGYSLPFFIHKLIPRWAQGIGADTAIVGKWVCARRKRWSSFIIFEILFHFSYKIITGYPVLILLIFHILLHEKKYISRRKYHKHADRYKHFHEHESFFVFHEYHFYESIYWIKLFGEKPCKKAKLPLVFGYQKVGIVLIISSTEISRSNDIPPYSGACIL